MTSIGIGWPLSARSNEDRTITYTWNCPFPPSSPLPSAAAGEEDKISASPRTPSATSRIHAGRSIPVPPAAHTVIWGLDRCGGRVLDAIASVGRFDVPEVTADDVLATHERPQDFRHNDGAVRLLIILEDCDEAAGRRHGRGVQRVREELVAADFPRARVQPPGLVVRAIAAADHLAVRILPRKPAFDVVLLRGDRADVPRADVHDSVRDLEGAVDRLAVRAEFLVPRPAVLRAAEHELLDFVELVHPEEALRVDAVAADLPSELRGESRERDREVRFLNDFVHVHRPHRMFRRCDEEQVFSVDLVHDRLEVPEVDDAFVRGAAHHERREDRREALLQHVIEREGQQGLVQAHEVSEEVDETGTRDLPRAFEVREPQRLAQVAVRLEFEIEFPRRAPSSDLDVLRIVLADRDALMEKVRQTEESLTDLRREFVDRLVERVDLLR